MGLERNDIEIERFGNISYVDPSNYFEAYSKIYDRPVNGTFSDGINFKYEDYNMAVDLEVQISNRYSCGISGATNTYKYSSTNGTLSFFGGKKLNNEDDTTYLTTNFTNVSNINPESNGECFGIESINITYQSWLFPEVNIRFVDVRGAAVMQPLEKEYLDGESKYNLIYKSFFLYPYPIYTLKVKGFYGMGVSYKLALDKSTIEFDSSNGNFIINAKFIGYMFGIYTDIPVSFVAVAPYLSEGRNYWLENTSEGGPFRFVGKNGEPAGPMYTIPQFRKKVSDASKEWGDKYTELLETQDVNTIDYKDKNVIENTINALIEIRNKDVVKNNSHLKFFTSLSEDYDIALYNNNDTFVIDNLVKSIGTIIELAKNYDISYSLKNGENLSGFLSYINFSGTSTVGTNIIKKYTNYGIGKVSYRREEDGSFKRITEENENYWIKKASSYNPNNPGTYSGGESIVNGNSSEYFVNKVTNFSDIEVFAQNEFYKEDNVNVLYFSIIFIPRKNKNVKVTSLTDIVNSKINYLNKEKGLRINEKIDSLIVNVEDSLGFYPSIYNIYKLLFAHFDTFIHCFYSRMKNILKELNNSEKSNRLKSNYSFSEEMTDAPKRVRNGSLGNYYPPFTGFYRENELGKKEFVWPPLCDVSMTNLEEMLFIKDMLKSSGNIESFLPDIVSKEKDEESLNKTINGYIVNYNNFIPLNGYDFQNFNKTINPYYYNGILFQCNDELCNFEALLKFATRIILNASDLRNHGYSYEQSYEDCGKNEAINLFCSVPNIQESFKYFVDRLKDMSFDKFIEYITTSDEYFKKPQSLKDCVFFGKDKKENLFYKYTSYENDFTAYPFKYNMIQDIDYDRQQSFRKNKNGKIELHDGVSAFTNSKRCEYAIFSENNKNNVFIVDKNIRNKVKNSVDKVKSATQQTKEINYLKKSMVSSYDSSYNEAINRINDAEHGKQRTRNTPEFITHTFASYDLAKSLYNLQDSIYVKAYLFLQPIKSFVDESSCGIDINPTYKINFIREGSYYWMKEYNGDIIYPDDWSGEKIKPKDGETFYKYYTKPNSVNSTIKYYKYTNYFSGASNERKELAISEFKKFAESISDVFYLFGEETLYEENRDGLISNYLSTVISVDSNAFKKLQEILTDIYFNNIYLIEYKLPSITKDELKKAFENFKSTLVELKNKFYTSQNAEKIGATSGIKFDSYTTSDLNLSLYLSLKNIYDKWLSFANNNEERWSLANTNSDFNKFLFIDTFYNNIGYKLSINPTKIASWLGRYFPSSEIEGNESVVYDSGKSFFEILADIAQECGGILMAFPQNFTKLENGDDRIRKMFTPVSINENWCEDSSVFVFMYNYKPASHLGDEESVSPFDMNGFNPNGDSLYLTKEDFNGYHYTNDDANIPAFGVSFGKQNQSIFTNVTLNTNTTTVTEASIAGTMNIAAKASQGPRETTLFGQDLYKVYGSYSYECNVEMMGNMQIMPTMFFQLNNIPLWKGVYQIKKVSHDIKAGDISTKIEGIKVNKYTVPILTPELILNKLKDFKYDDENDTENTTQETFVGSDEGNSSVDISKNTTKNADSEYDFDIENVSKENPLICLTPAHGPYTEKNREYEWSTNLVNMIADKLRKSDKMPWLKNNVHTCNKNGANTSSDGYSTKETKTLAERCGENNVISIVPHWNGGGANRLQIFWELGPIGPKTNIREEEYIANEESLILAKCFAEVFKNRPEPPTTNPAMPFGAMDGRVEVGSLRELSQRYMYKDKYGKDKYVYDGAVMLRCPAILVETWYADYSSSDRYNLKKWEKYIGETLPVGERHDQNVDEYTIMASWLNSKKGLEYVSDLYVQGIYAYLSDREERRKKGEIE